MEEPTYSYDSYMTFGIVFLIVLTASTVYAIGRTVYEKWIKPPVVEETPAVILFSEAVRLAGAVARDRVIAEADTKVLVLPRNPDGSLAPPERAGHPGATTVDVPAPPRAIGRHAVRPRPSVPEAA